MKNSKTTMYAHFLCLSLVLCTVQISQAQTPYLLRLPLKTDSQTPVFALNTGKKASELPNVVSLRAYCPAPQHQGKNNACTAWATTYGALTIMRAIQSDVRDTAILQRMSHSAAFVYNNLMDGRTKNPCETGVSLRACLLFLQTKGACLAANFSNTSDCSQKPDTTLWEEAERYKITDFGAVFRAKDDSIVKILQMRRLLAARKPVVIAFYITPSFSNLTDSTEVWSPTKEEPIMGGHAVVIIGYNQAEQSFELMNSWGRDWGHHGFAKISYSDFIQRTAQAYYLDF
jgi:hypothetical protein